MDSNSENIYSLLLESKEPISLREFLLRLMKENNLTQTRIFELSGVAESSISTYLSGKTSMTCDNFEKIINCILKNRSEN
jgi:transcriptional regulator with XRE-family HTH domain